MRVTVDISVAFEGVTSGRFMADPTIPDVSDAVTRATLSALHGLGLTDEDSIDVSIRMERSL